MIVPARIFMSLFVVFFLTMELVPSVLVSLQAEVYEVLEHSESEAEKEGKESKKGREVDEYVVHALSGNTIADDARFIRFEDYHNRYIRPVLEGPLMPPEFV